MKISTVLIAKDDFQDRFCELGRTLTYDATDTVTFEAHLSKWLKKETTKDRTDSYAPNAIVFDCIKRIIKKSPDMGAESVLSPHTPMVDDSAETIYIVWIDDDAIESVTRIFGNDIHGIDDDSIVASMVSSNKIPNKTWRFDDFISEVSSR